MGENMGELYKSSFYNRFYEVGGRYWIFNTLNQGLLEVPEQSFRLLQNNKFDIEKCDQDMLEDINELIENEFVVFENYNELKTIKNLFHNDKYKRDYMSVTIIPTLECNCACFYCFERQHHIKQEDSFDWNKVTEGILYYIEEKLPYVKTLNIAWFGGEPLLKIKEIDDLSEKLIALTEKYGVDYTASMTTNGTRLKYIPDVCNRLKKNKISNIQIRNTITEEQYGNYITELLTIPDKIQKILQDKERLQWFAAKYANAHDVFFVGRGIDYAISLEGSLKLKEISYIHSEAYAAGELKHGTISLIEPGTLVIGVLTQSDLYEKTISNMLECKSRGAYLMGLTTYGKYEIEDQVNFAVYVPKIDEHFVGSLAVVPLQLMGYYVSVAKGLDVDKPRNLAKSVTVE